MVHRARGDAREGLGEGLASSAEGKKTRCSGSHSGGRRELATLFPWYPCRSQPTLGLEDAWTFGAELSIKVWDVGDLDTGVRVWENRWRKERLIIREVKSIKHLGG